MSRTQQQSSDRLPSQEWSKSLKDPPPLLQLLFWGKRFVKVCSCTQLVFTKTLWITVFPYWEIALEDTVPPTNECLWFGYNSRLSRSSVWIYSSCSKTEKKSRLKVAETPCATTRYRQQIQTQPSSHMKLINLSSQAKGFNQRPTASPTELNPKL